MPTFEADPYPKAVTPVAVMLGVIAPLPFVIVKPVPAVSVDLVRVLPVVLPISNSPST